MQIKDLPAPITASKADWLAGDDWLGFTPTGTGSDAQEKCQSTIRRQFGNGFVLEYVTEQFNEPNPGFENAPDYLAEIEAHKPMAGRLIAVHRLRATHRPLIEIIGKTAFERLQDKWAQNGKRIRWSVAFPIVESYEILDLPKAKDVFGDASYRSLYARSSATLRELNDEQRDCLSELFIKPRISRNAWIGIEDEFEAAKRSEINRRTQSLVDLDLGALEGVAEERRAKVKRRAAWLADSFIRNRQKDGTLRCDDCNFDPVKVFPTGDVKPRSLLDVHHKTPLDEGVRYTTVADFALLCPTCHRIEHARIRLKSF